MNRAHNKAARLIQIEQLLLAHPEGLTQAELARRLSVNRSTISRNLADVPGYIYEDEDGRIKIDRQAELINLRLSLPEALAIHIAARLMSRQMDRQNRHAAAALRKLGHAMERYARRISQHVLQSANDIDSAGQLNDPVYLNVFECLTDAWTSGRKVRIWYQIDTNERIYEYLLSPYFIEPYPIGQTTYVIGKALLLGDNGWNEEKMRTFKIERICRAELTQESYQIPADFDPHAYLADAWVIWSNEGEPVEVALRFTARVAQRVQETRWHRYERTELQSDGSLIWRARIAEPKEMLPWIRGWGADCEVLEPAWLRKKIEREVREMARVYRLSDEGGSQVRFFAHRRDGEARDEWQPLIEHLKNTAEMAREFGRHSNIAELAYIAGLIHDLGKYSAEFQKRLEGGPRVDHSTAGAKELKTLLKDPRLECFAQLLMYPIMGHHSGLPDYGHETDLDGGTVCARLKKDIPDYSAYKNELDLSSLPFPKHLHIKPQEKYPGFSFAFLIRMVFSALVDADFQETESYMQGKKPRGNHKDVTRLYQDLDRYLECFKNPTSDIDRKRNETLHACIEHGKSLSPGFFSLTIPTGGGKTLASMAFALHHAVKNGLRRIIYVIPFTTIIEQNAAVFKNIFGEENVLEHHSNFDWETRHSAHPEDQTNSVLAKLKLAAENWDIPIVVTTNVQFFESLFANTPSRCRKLHNIARSVIIFDEAHMLPREYMRPAMAAVWELVTNYSASAIFCTATQPGLERFLPEGTFVRELAPNPQELFSFYKRVEVKNLGTLTDEELLERLSAHEQVLCIVNTRRHASGLFRGLQGEGNYHLSTLMCPAHRRTTLTAIRRRLIRGEPCRVISTTVMEAGVDLDFPVGYRALAGLDSINQAAGRVNREMRHNVGKMFIFEPKSQFIQRIPSFVQQSAEVARMVLRDHATEPISIQAIRSFFDQLYDLQDSNISFDHKQIMNDLSDENCKFSFATASSKFRIIEDKTVTIVIPYNKEVIRLIEDLKETRYPLAILRKLQPYTVSIYETEFEQLCSKGVISTINDTYHFLDPYHAQYYYDSHQGLLIPESSGGDGLLF
ncbi:CRISPR-associated helicase Cas3' [Chloroflexus sp.]|uniref:CRISPR-associated helicase Cas3' n=1 Tax=Chloroflexus sp. TaxID=1904827 RepID=UPI0026349B5F|nr:CRISPR-associated helicase Cas3' [uncultured Chloroflexus sp.]